MMASLHMKYPLMLTVCMVLVVCVCGPGYAEKKELSEKKELTIPVALLRSVLEQAGVEAMVEVLDEEERIRQGTRVYVSIDGSEAVLELTEDGTFVVVEADDSFLERGVDEFVECVLDVVEEFLDKVENCGINPFCYWASSLKLSVDVPVCVTRFLSESL